MVREKQKILFSNFIIILICMVCIILGCTKVCAEEKSVRDFIGWYLAETPKLDEYRNPEVIKLYFNDNGNLERYSGLFYGTTGTTICYEYTNFKVKDNTLICDYHGAFSPYNGPRNDIPAGSHQYVMDHNGNIITEDCTWYRYETEEEMQSEPGMLQNVEETDFLGSQYSEEASFLGIENLKRKDVEEITFLDSLEEKPDAAWDVSRDADGSVWAWIDNSDGITHLIIAGNGGIAGNIESGSLFRLCTNVRKIDFNNCFDTSKTNNMKAMFAYCYKLEDISGIENWDTVNVENMESMFEECNSLKLLDVSSFDTSRAWQLNRMFYKCTSLENLNIDQFKIRDSTEYTDIFTGTIREGDAAALSEERNKRVITSYILDTNEFAFSDSFLRAKVINSYDDMLKNMKDSVDMSNLMYAICDINGDGIPELIIKNAFPESYVYYAFSYDQKLGKVESVIGSELNSRVNELDFCEEGHQLACYKDDGYQLYLWKGNQFIEAGVVDQSKFNSMLGFEKLEFCYAYPDLLWNQTIDLKTIEEDDSEKQQLVIYGEKGEYGYTSILLYVDTVNVFTKQLLKNPTQISISEPYINDGTVWLCVRMFSEIADDYCGIIRYKCELRNQHS